MEITYSCPTCRGTIRGRVSASDGVLLCAQCRQEISMPAGAMHDGRLRRCVVCPSVDLFVRKDFPQRLGVTIVTLGLLASCVAWGYNRPILTFAILLATALADVVLYVLVPSALMCYRCGAMYRDVPHLDEYASFNLEMHERHRQQKIRLATAQRATTKGYGHEEHEAAAKETV